VAAGAGPTRDFLPFGDGIVPCRSNRPAREDELEKVRRMLFTTLFVLALVAFILFAFWSAVDDWKARSSSRSVPSESTGTSHTPADRPRTLEGVLATQLIAGEITRNQYHRALAKLAARDEERHPLAAPPEIGTADA